MKTEKVSFIEEIHREENKRGAFLRKLQNKTDKLFKYDKPKRNHKKHS